MRKYVLQYEESFYLISVFFFSKSFSLFDSRHFYIETFQICATHLSISWPVGFSYSIVITQLRVLIVTKTQTSVLRATCSIEPITPYMRLAPTVRAGAWQAECKQNGNTDTHRYARIPESERIGLNVHLQFS